MRVPETSYVPATGLKGLASSVILTVSEQTEEGAAEAER